MTSKLRDDRYVDCKDLIQKYGSEEAALHSVIERSYDNFSLTLTDIQVIFYYYVVQASHNYLIIVGL